MRVAGREDNTLAGRRSGMKCGIGEYVHGYSEREAVRLTDQATTLATLLHHDTSYPRGSLVLEAGSGVGAQTGTIAAVLGTDLIPPVVAFKEGYEAGARSVNPDISIISTYHPGGLDVAFTDPEWGATTAAQAIANGADVVFGAGGKTGNGALIETAGTAGLYCIGVDSDQWETVPEAHACLISSAMKLITPAVFDLVKLAQEGNMPSGNYYGAAGLAPFHDFDSTIPQDVKDLINTTAEGLLDGSITTGYGG